ncbi:hypothetical protein ZIOFF_003816 [Zingiber officinale]|uniref:CBS domain-containing protein n=1 Tax=Zingiber officinale TaxID=94328 RepID=A0A8J5IUB5_ZINOF|nr:hypothetical protein ZIOFF_003816 [Zingiber officinale]
MVVKFLYGHGTIVSLMRKYTNGKEILRPAVTRFATSFLTLQSMYKVKRPLEQMFASEDWVSSPLSQTTQGKVVKRIVINDPNFWPHVAFGVKSVVPLKEGPVLPVTTKWLEDDELFESDPIVSMSSATFESLFDSDKRIEDVEDIVEVPPTNSKKKKVVENSSGSKDKQARLSLIDVEDNHLDAENYGGLKSKVNEIMSSPAITLSGDKTVLNAAALMLKMKIHRVPILDAEQKVIGKKRKMIKTVYVMCCAGIFTVELLSENNDVAVEEERRSTGLCHRKERGGRE